MTDQSSGPGAGTYYPPPPPPPPPFSPPPPPPPPYGPPYATGPRRLRRSSTNRRIAGVAGGLGDYLGVDATALRVGFVLVSLLFLGGIGGPLLYVVAWIFVPEEGRDYARSQSPFSSPPWQEWRRDRTARSWALVLGALTLALFWSFGFWPWWHWRALPVLLALTGTALWFLVRPHGPAGGWAGPPPGGYPGAGGPMPSGGGTTTFTSGPVGTTGPVGGGTGPDGTTGPEAADWAQARSTAADWAASQLAAAGVSPVPPAPPRPPRPKTGRRVLTVCVAILCGLLLCGVLAVLSVTFGSGSSLRGGMGDNTFAPSSAAAVARHYRLGAGNLDVNLSAVTFPARGQAVEVTVGMGHLTVELPTNADVTVNAHVGLGHVDVWGQSGSDVQAQWPPGGTGPKGAPYLTLDAHVGVGDIEVTRGAPSSGPGAPLPPQRP